MQNWNTGNCIAVRNFSSAYKVLMNHLSLWNGYISQENSNSCDRPLRFLLIKVFCQLVFANIGYRTYVLLKHAFICFLYTSSNGINILIVFIFNGLYLEHTKNRRACSVMRVDLSRLGHVVLLWFHKCTFNPLHS